MSQPDVKYSCLFTDDERKILTAFIDVGMKADVLKFGLSRDSGNTVLNAIHLAKLIQDATPVQQLKVAPPQSEDITDPPAENRI